MIQGYWFTIKGTLGRNKTSAFVTKSFCATRYRLFKNSINVAILPPLIIDLKNKPKTGKNSFAFFSQNNFAWLLDKQEEKSFVKTMKRATDLIVKARTTKGAETTDHYSMMGFTKAYNTAKKTCS